MFITRLKRTLHLNVKFFTRIHDSASTAAYRFIPSEPIWRRFDIKSTNVNNELSGEVTNQACVTNNDDVFHIDDSELPKPTEFDVNTIKLLKRLSLLELRDEQTLSILGEAIRFADPVLTRSAFIGTDKSGQYDAQDVKPIILLCDEIPFTGTPNCPLDADRPKIDPETSAHLLAQVPKIWENYIVTPTDNKPVELENVIQRGRK